MNFYEELMKIDNRRLFIALRRYIETMKKRDISIYSYQDSFSIYCNYDRFLYKIIYCPNKIVINSINSSRDSVHNFNFNEFTFECLIASIIDFKSENILNKIHFHKKEFIFFIKCKLI